MAGLAVSDVLSCLAVVLGVFLRSLVFIFNRPFWTDEAQLALNIRMHSWSELMGPLDFSQAAPPFFLLLEKCLVQVLGESDFVLRIVPFSAGVGSLIVFTVLARRLLSKNAVPVGIFLFALSEPLIRYATEFKQYSTDVFLSLLFLFLLSRFERPCFSNVNALLMVVLAIIGPWFSYPLIFVVFASASVGIFSASRNSLKKQVFWGLAVLTSVVSSALVLYWLSLSLIVSGASRDALMDLRSVPPHNISVFGWFYQKIAELLFFPGGFAQLGIGLAVICLIVGFLQLRSRHVLMVSAVLLAFQLVLVSSWFSIYPLYGRFLLFLTPMLLLFVAEGALWLYDLLGAKSPGLAKIIFLLLFLPRFEFFLSKGEQAWLRHTDVRGALQYIQRNKADGDLIYLYYGSFFPAKYYCRALGLREEDMIVGVPGYWWNSNLRESLMKSRSLNSGFICSYSSEVVESYRNDDFSPQWKAFEDDVRRLVGHERVWVLFSLSNWLGSNEEKIYLYFLDKYGERMTCSRTSGASVYLYNMVSGQKKASSQSPK